jgi:hypothetical protein
MDERAPTTNGQTQENHPSTITANNQKKDVMGWWCTGNAAEANCIPSKHKTCLETGRIESKAVGEREPLGPSRKDTAISRAGKDSRDRGRQCDVLWVGV